MAPHTDFSRRRVLAGAAWTVPAVVIATSAPASASSGATVSGDALHDYGFHAGAGGSDIWANVSYALSPPAGWPSGVDYTTVAIFSVHDASGAFVDAITGTRVIVAPGGANPQVVFRGLPAGVMRVTVTVAMLALEVDGTQYVSSSIVREAIEVDLNSPW